MFSAAGFYPGSGFFPAAGGGAPVPAEDPGGFNDKSRVVPLLPLLPPPVALADSRGCAMALADSRHSRHGTLHADLKDKTRAQLTRKMDAGEQLAGVKATSFTAAGAGTSEYVYCPGMDVDNARFTTNRKAFGLTYAGFSGVRFVDADLETFPAGGYVRAAKDPAARAAGV